MTDVPDPTPGMYKAQGYGVVITDDHVDCPDCGSPMRYKKPLDSDALDVDMPISAYRCGGCTAIEFVAETADVHPLDVTSARSLVAATLEADGRGEL